MTPDIRVIPGAARNLVVAVLLPVTFYVSAQEPLQTIPVEEPPASEEPQAQQLDPLTVTAQKHSQDLQDVPISMTVIDGSTLERLHVENVEDISRHTANAQFNLAQGQPFLYIRGIGATELQSVESAIGAFRDGVYLGRHMFLFTPMLDVEQIEVLRGPQGALLGKNNTAGAISIATAMPGDTTEFSAGGYIGSRAHRQVQAAGTLRFAEDWGLRFALMDERRDGYMRNTRDPSRDAAVLRRAGRMKLAWQPQGPWAAWLSLERGLREDSAIPGQITRTTPELQRIYGRYDPQIEGDPDNYQNSLDYSSLSGQADLSILSVTRELDFGDGATFSALSNYGRLETFLGQDGDFGPAPIFHIPVFEDSRTLGQELRLRGSAGAFDYTVGAYYGRSELPIYAIFGLLPEGAEILTPELAALLLLAGLPDPLGSEQSVKDFRQSGRVLSLFGELDWGFAPKWSLLLGARYTRDDKRLRFINTHTGSGSGFKAALNEEEFDERRTRNEADLSPRAGLRYELTPDLNFYGVYQRAFKGGGYSVFSGRREQLEFEEERVEGVEAGLKGYFFDRALALNLNLFNSDYDDLQVLVFNGSFVRVVNAPRARIRGAELDGRWLIGSGLSLSGSLGLLDSRFVSFPDGPAQTHEGDPPSSVTAAAGNDNMQDLSGQTLPRSPRVSGALSLEYASPLLWRDFGLTTGLGLSHRGRHFLTPDLDPVDVQPATTLVNAFIALAPGDGRWTMTLAGVNLTERVQQVTGLDVPFFAGAHLGTTEQPRRVDLSLRYRW